MERPAFLSHVSAAEYKVEHTTIRDFNKMVVLPLFFETYPDDSNRYLTCSVSRQYHNKCTVEWRSFVTVARRFTPCMKGSVSAASASVAPRAVTDIAVRSDVASRTASIGHWLSA